MFEITMNGKTLYHPNATDCVVTNAVIHEALNDVGYMDITVPYLNPLYDEIEERNSKIIVYKDNEPIWYGMVQDVLVDFGKNKSLYIVGEAAYLNDSAQPQKSYEDTKFKIFEALINNHNSQVEANKRFMVGTVGINANVRRKVVTDWEYTLDAIRKHLCGDDEYFRIRHVGNNRYIDIMPLDSYGKRSDQVIQFGENLLDYAEDISGEGLATVCIPLGAPLENEAIEGHSNYLTCVNAKSQNGKNYVELPSAITKLGRITKIVHFNVLTDPNALVTAAVNYLQSAQYSKLSLTLSAVDLSILHSDIDNYSVGDYVRAICEPMGMDSWFPVRERETDLINIANNSITVGAEGTKSFTTQQIETIEDIQNILASNTRESILYTALKNASNLINANGQNGYVSIRTDNNNKPYEIIIMDAETITQSTRAWRWNLNGFGHGTKKAGASEFTWKTNVAITMDGAISADSIISGSMMAERIKGGSLEIGGKQYADDGKTQNKTYNAAISVKDNTGKEVVKISRDGIDIDKGSITIGENFNVDTDGVMTATSVDLTGGLTSEASDGATASIQDGIIRSNRTVTAAGFSTTGANSGVITNNVYSNNYYAENLAGISKTFSITNAYVDGALRSAVGLSFTKGILTNITY